MELEIIRIIGVIFFFFVSGDDGFPFRACLE